MKQTDNSIPDAQCQNASDENNLCGADENLNAQSVTEQSEQTDGVGARSGGGYDAATMTESGTVTATEGDLATVRLYRSSACGSCTACGLSSEKKYIDLQMNNVCGAQVGDTVSIRVRSVSATRLSVIIYLIPLAVALIALVAAALLGAPDILSVGVFIFGLGLGFLAVHFIDKKRGKSLGINPVMTGIISEASREGETK